MTRHWKLVIELRNVPFETQRDIMFWLIPRLPRFGHGAFDATGNGAYLAEKAAQKFGERISEVKLSQEWYRANSPAYIEAFGDQSITIAADEDVVRDHQALQWIMLPGFTTRATATQVSGRGVGLDAVHSTVQALGGSLRVASERGRGTSFHLSVPINTAITSVLMFHVG